MEAIKDARKELFRKCFEAGRKDEPRDTPYGDVLPPIEFEEWYQWYGTTSPSNIPSSEIFTLEVTPDQALIFKDMWVSGGEEDERFYSLDGISWFKLKIKEVLHTYRAVLRDDCLNENGEFSFVFDNEEKSIPTQTFQWKSTNGKDIPIGYCKYFYQID